MHATVAPRVALLGDSIFDNAPYTQGGPAVIDHLRRVLSPGWSADLLALDGAYIDEVRGQLLQLQPEHTHLVLSVGGNDVLLSAGVLELEVRTSGEAFLRLADEVDAFALRYRACLDACLATGRPLVVATIYEGWFDDPVYQRLVQTALRAFNDVIIRSAGESGLRVIELRRVCCAAEHYANPIEPSVAGGARIAQAIAQAVLAGPPPAGGAFVAG